MTCQRRPQERGKDTRNDKMKWKGKKSPAVWRSVRYCCWGCVLPSWVCLSPLPPRQTKWVSITLVYLIATLTSFKKPRLTSYITIILYIIGIINASYRSLSVIVASPAISPTNSTTLIYVTIIAVQAATRYPLTATLVMLAIPVLWKAPPIDDQIDKVSWLAVRDLRSSTKEGSISCLGCFVTGSRVCGLIRLTTSFSRLSR